MTTTKTATLAGALVLAQRDIHTLDKEATNSFHKYKYVSAEAVVAAARDALLSHGITVDREFTIAEPQAVAPNIPILHSVFHIVHGESGEGVVRRTEWYIVEGQGRPIDKAHAGALTSSLAYFLRDLLMIPKQEEGDSLDKRDDRAAQPRAAKPRPKPQAAAEPSAAAGGELGFAGALALRKQLTGAGLEIDALVTAMGSSGIVAPDDPAEWQAEWLPRIQKWILSQAQLPAPA